MPRFAHILTAGGVVAVCLTVIGAGKAYCVSYSQSVLSDSPIVYWRLGEPSGPTAFDATVNSVNGTYVGAVTPGVAGAIATDGDTAASFDGSSGRVETVASPLINQLTNDFTIEAWIHRDAPSPIASQIVSTRETNFAASVQSGFGLNVTQGGLLRFATFGIKAYDGPAVQDGQWTHVAVVFDSSNDAHFYRNGVFTGTVVGESPAVTNTLPMFIGRNVQESFTGFHYFDGSIDEVAIYGTSLSAGRIQAHYLAAVPEPSTLALAAFGVGAFAAWGWRRR